MNKVPRMRTIPKAYADIKAIDPQTDLTIRALRDMVKRGDVPIVKIKSKTLVNLDLLIAKLGNMWYDDNATDIS